MQRTFKHGNIQNNYSWLRTERFDTRDAFLCHQIQNLQTFKNGPVFGTPSIIHHGRAYLRGPTLHWRDGPRSNSPSIGYETGHITTVQQHLKHDIKSVKSWWHTTNGNGHTRRQLSLPNIRSNTKYWTWSLGTHDGLKNSDLDRFWFCQYITHTSKKFIKHWLRSVTYTVSYFTIKTETNIPVTV